MIVAGGAGTRLWPLSVPQKPKQLLPLTSEKSLVRCTYERAKLLTDDVYIVTTKALLPAIKKQIPELKLHHYIVEPDRRGTGNCIVLALHHLHRRHADNEPVVFLYSDYHIVDDDAFVETFTRAAEAAARSDKIVLVGSRPERPSTALGYIEQLRELTHVEGVFRVGRFREKPGRALANQFVKAGNYLWSSGYYVATPRTFLFEISAHAPNLAKNYWVLNHLRRDRQKLTEKYLSFDTLAIDKEVIEASRNMLVVEAGFGWTDVGNFKDLHSVGDRDENENTTKGHVHLADTKNTYVESTTSKPVIVIGAKDLAVINTEHGVLVVDKKHAHRVGDELKKMGGGST